MSASQETADRTGQAQAPAAPSVGRVTALTALFTALGPITMSMYAPAMPSLAEALNASVGMVQLTLTVYLIAFAAAQLVYGPLSDRFGRRPVLLAGLGIFLVGSAAAAAAPNIELLLVARFVQAVGVCAGSAVARAVVRDLFDGHRAAQVMATLGMALTIAPAVGPVLGGYLDVWVGWRAIFLFQTGFGVLTTLITWTMLRETNAYPDPTALNLLQIARNARLLTTSRVFVGYAAAASCLLGGQFTFAAVGPFAFVSELGLSPALYGWLTLFTTGAYFFGSMLARRDVARIGVEKLVSRGVLWTLGGGVLLFAAAFGYVSVPTLIAPMMLTTFGMGLVMPGAMTGALAPFPRIAGTASSVLGFFQMGMGAVGAAAAGMFDVASWAMGVIPLAMYALGAAIFVAAIRPRSKT